MGKLLNDAQIKAFHDEGVLFPIDVMSPEEAALVLGKLEAAEAAYPEVLSPTNRNNAHLIFPFLDAIVHHPIICDAVEDLIGDSFYAWGTVIFAKEPQDGGFVSWHQDATYMGLEPHSGVSAWLALTPSTLESGCMKMLPGTHKGDIRPHKDTFGADNLLTRGQTIEGIEEDQAVDLILRPGQMSLHHPRIIHGSSPNRSNRRRVGFTTQAYIPPNVRQTRTEGLCQRVRGSDPFGHMTPLPRPSVELAPQDLENRRRVNQTWQDILYHGAARKRAY